MQAEQLHEYNEFEESEPRTPEPLVEPLQVEPPDGGYGWVVVGASFINLVFLSSALLAFPIFLPEFLNTLGKDYQTLEVAVIGSTQTGVMLYFSKFMFVL